LPFAVVVAVLACHPVGICFAFAVGVAVLVCHPVGICFAFAVVSVFAVVFRLQF
jgi:hypothetical protein